MQTFLLLCFSFWVALGFPNPPAFVFDSLLHIRCPQSICSLITFSHTGERARLSLSGCTDVHRNNQINLIPMSVILQNLLTFGLETFFLSLLDKQ